MRIGRIRNHKNTFEVTLVFTREDAKHLSHAIECRSSDHKVEQDCSFPKMFTSGRELLHQLYRDVLIDRW